MKIKELIAEGRNYPIIVVDVQPAYANYAPEICQKIVEFAGIQQTGPVLMFVNADETGLTEDSISSVIDYWNEFAEINNATINWRRFTINDKGYGYLRSWMDAGIDDRIIIKTIRLMYQQKIYDSSDLNITEEQYPDIAEAIDQMRGDTISVGWTSVAQLKKFNGAYIVGGARNECLKEVELLMNAFNIKYKRIDSLVY